MLVNKSTLANYHWAKMTIWCSLMPPLLRRDVSVNKSMWGMFTKVSYSMNLPDYVHISMNVNANLNIMGLIIKQSPVNYWYGCLDYASQTPILKLHVRVLSPL